MAFVVFVAVPGPSARRARRGTWASGGLPAPVRLSRQRQGPQAHLRDLAQTFSFLQLCPGVTGSAGRQPPPENILTLGPPLLWSSHPSSSELFGHQLFCFKLRSLPHRCQLPGVFPALYDSWTLWERLPAGHPGGSVDCGPRLADWAALGCHFCCWVGSLF